MSSVLLAPHHDDETLFAAFTIMREKPKVIIVLESHLQEQRGNEYEARTWESDQAGNGTEVARRWPITNAVRQDETRAALSCMIGYGYWPVIGDAVEFWEFRDDDPDWRAIESRIYEIEADMLYVPATHVGGHEHHNKLNNIVWNIERDEDFNNQSTFPAVTYYTTYVRGTPDERVATHREVKPEPWMVAHKLAALACYRSQIHLWPHHFLSEQREFYA